MIKARDLYETPVDAAITALVGNMIKSWGRREVITALYTKKLTTVPMLNVHVDNMYSHYGPAVIRDFVETYFKQTLQEVNVKRML